jgi:hypothetical protein
VVVGDIESVQAVQIHLFEERLIQMICDGAAIDFDINMFFQQGTV